jgi:hypothetical protein
MTLACTVTASPATIASVGGRPRMKPAGTGSDTRATAATGSGAGFEIVNWTSRALAVETVRIVNASASVSKPRHRPMSLNIMSTPLLCETSIQWFYKATRRASNQEDQK